MAADDADDEAFIRADLAAIEAQIIAYRAAMANIASGAIQSYELSTGQTTQRVTKVNMFLLQGAIDRLWNDRQTKRALLNGGSTHVVPSW